MEYHIETLKSKYGNHSRVAKILGITVRHYRRIRNDHLRPSKPLSKLILLKIQEIEDAK